MNRDSLKELYVKLIAKERLEAKDGVDSIDTINDWYKGYKEAVENVVKYREKIKNGYRLSVEDDIGFFENIFITKGNGIASKGNSTLFNKAYEDLIRDKDFLNIFHNSILDPSLENYNIFIKFMAQFIDNSKLKYPDNTVQNRPLIYNRFFAACTTDVSVAPDQRNQFPAIVEYLNRQDLIEIPNDFKEKNWYEQNIYIVAQVREALADFIENGTTDEYWINIFIQMVHTLTLNPNNEYKSTDVKMSKFEKNYPLNQILFGPAGTGKTYHTVNHALQIIDPDFYEAYKAPEQRDALKHEFQKYVDNGQIQFVTFHQSFSYEDFVEGIRVTSKEEIDKDGNIVSFLEYPVLSGIFKKICEKAEYQNYSENDIDEIINLFVDEISNNELVLETKTGAEFTVFSSSGKGGISVRTTTQNEIVISKKAIKLYLLEPSENIRKNQAYAWAVANYLKPRVNSINSVKERSKPFIIIIDEINRGNISRIFGELITLIEESKRKGNAEELSTVLPYSKESFSVPNNLYIIGTMNSSDRSLTGLDLALRRRFTFTEMAPNPALLSGVKVDGIEIDRLLDIINQRIEILLDRDHCIGHAYFMPLKDKPELSVLKDIFLQKIIPLLQEYFFDDWEYIYSVLNENGMLKQKYDVSKMNGLFKNPKSMNRDIWEVNTQVFDDLKAYQAIYTGTDLEAE